MMEKEERKASVLEAIANLTERNGFPPSYREIGTQIGLAHSAVFGVVEDLRRDGLIHDRQALRSRAITLTDAGRAAVGTDNTPVGSSAV